MLGQILTLHQFLDQHTSKILLVHLTHLDELVRLLTGILSKRLHVLTLLGNLISDAVNQLQHVIERQIAYLPLVEDILFDTTANLTSMTIAGCKFILVELLSTAVAEQFVITLLAECFQLSQRLVFLLSSHSPSWNDTSPIRSKSTKLILFVLENRNFKHQVLICNTPLLLQVCTGSSRIEVLVSRSITVA